MPAVVALIAVILVLAVVVAIIYGYIVGVIWFFQHAAHDIVLVTALIGVSTTPILYGRALLDTYSRPGLRSIALIPVIALLFFLYIDLVYLINAAALTLSPSALSAWISEELHSVVFGGWLSERMLRFLISRLPVDVSGWWILVAGMLTRLMLMYPFLFLSRGLRNEQRMSSGGQPAFLHYFVRQAWLDLRALYQSCADGFSALLHGLEQVGKRILIGPQAVVIWPLVVAMGLGLVVPGLAAATSLAILAGLHALAMVVIWLWVQAAAGVLIAAEKALLWVRTGYVKCPHSGCHEPISLPIFRCDCGQKHDRLLPGRYGIFLRRCLCDKSLPTLFLTGKGHLQSTCPHCENPLRDALFTSNAHIPIYGGASAGKTMFMTAATWTLIESSAAGIKAQLIDERASMDYRKRWKPSFERGDVREKTVALLPDAFLLGLKRRGGDSLSLYMYDPDGAAMGEVSVLSQHRFLQYFDGMVLMVDPLSLQSIQEAYEDAHQPLPPQASQTDPLEIVDRLVNIMEQKGLLSRGRQFPRKLAVVFSKADLPLVRKTIGEGSARENTSRWSRRGETSSARISAWLKQSEPALFQSIDSRFSNVRFFVSSAQGGSSGRGFTPWGVLSPLLWILSQQQVLRRPILMRSSGVLLQVGAVGAVLALISLPVGAATWALWPAPPLQLAPAVEQQLEVIPHADALLRLEHSSDAQVVVFSPDGTLIVTGHESGLVRVWDSQTGEALRELHSGPGGIEQLTFRRDGSLLAAAGRGLGVRVWDTIHGVSQMLEGPFLAVTDVAFSPDGKILAATCQDGRIWMWQSPGWEALEPLRPERTPLAIAFTPDGRTLVVGDRDGIQLIDLRRQRSLSRLKTALGRVSKLAFSPRGDLLAISGGGHAVQVLDWRRGRSRHILSGHEFPITSLAWSPDGAELATLTEDGELLWWDITSGEKVEGRQIGSLARGVGWSPDGARLATAGEEVYVWSR